MSTFGTIKNKITICGKTPFSGIDATVTFLPAERGSGIRFIRQDLNNAIIKAMHENIDIADCFNYTSITNGKDKIKFPEHILCYLWMTKITDIDILINTEEFPIFDGSCDYFNFCFQASEIKRFEDEIPKLILKKELKVVNPWNNSYIIAKPSNDFIVSFDICFEEKTIQNDIFTFNTSSMNFFDEIMPARTFITTALKDKVAKVNKNYLPNSYIEFGDENIIAEEKLRFSNEPTRHKILDVIGDFALLNMELQLELYCYRSGHYANNLMVKEIMSNSENYHIETA